MQVLAMTGLTEKQYQWNNKFNIFPSLTFIANARKSGVSQAYWKLTIYSMKASLCFAGTEHANVAYGRTTRFPVDAISLVAVLNTPFLGT